MQSPRHFAGFALILGREIEDLGWKIDYKVSLEIKLRNDGSEVEEVFRELGTKLVPFPMTSWQSCHAHSLLGGSLKQLALSFS